MVLVNSDEVDKFGFVAHRSFRFWPVFRAILAFVAASFRSRTALQLEILAVRDQVCVLQRSVKRPKLTATDRFVWGWLSSVWDGWESGVFIVKAATVIGWHRRALACFGVGRFGAVSRDALRCRKGFAN